MTLISGSNINGIPGGPAAAVAANGSSLALETYALRVIASDTAAGKKATPLRFCQPGGQQLQDVFG